VKLEYEVQGGDFAHAGSASSQVKRILKQINLEHGLIKRIVVALYEAEVNIVAHAYRGRISIDIDVERILIRLADEGPGIPDIDLAMQEGYSTASPEVREMGFGAGMGLSNIKKNADELAIESEVGKGTTVTILIKFKEGT
jgi:anti-sigma regulatory factor (Ser/Thr protein kinase)